MKGARIFRDLVNAFVSKNSISVQSIIDINYLIE